MSASELTAQEGSGMRQEVIIEGRGQDGAELKPVVPSEDSREVEVSLDVSQKCKAKRNCHHAQQNLGHLRELKI